MAKTSYSLSHTKWMCKYHIVFTPKYRRKVIYNNVRSDFHDLSVAFSKQLLLMIPARFELAIQT